MKAPQFFPAGIAILVAFFLGGCSCCHSSQSTAKKGAVVYHGRETEVLPREIPPRCSPAWNQMVDAKLKIGDGAGHGPDVGGAEWMNAVSRKSGVEDSAGHGPDPGSDEWCRAVDFKVFGRR